MFPNVLLIGATDLEHEFVTESLLQSDELLNKSLLSDHPTFPGTHSTRERRLVINHQRNGHCHMSGCNN
jgi:hypothetical protein